MTEHTVSKANKAVTGLAAVAVATAAFVTSATGAAPTANATCASFFGIGNGNGCQSSFGGIAIGLGSGATAVASGFFSTAFGFGDKSSAHANGNLNLAVAAGFRATAIAGNDINNNDVLQVATTFGDRSVALSETQGQGGYLNFATNLGNEGLAESIGAFNTSMNLTGANTVVAAGIANSATNIGGHGNLVESFNNSTSNAGLNNAFNLFGSNNTVFATTGPFAIAGTIFQNNTTVTQTKTGFNINGSAGSPAAPKQAAARTVSLKTVKPAASVGHKKSTGSAAAPKHASK